MRPNRRSAVEALQASGVDKYDIPAFLRKQARLAELQAQELSHELGLRHWSLWVRHLSGVLKLTFEIGLAVFAVGLASQIMLNGSFVFTLPAAHVFYRGLGSDMDDDFHDTICHTDPGDSSSQTRVHRGVVYAMENLAYFLEKMKSMTEGSGSLLDGSLIYVTSDIAWGKVHSVADWPVLLFGKSGGQLAGNRHLRMPGDNLSKVLFTIADQMGC